MNIELYKGSVVQDGARATVLLPYVEEDMKKGDTVRLVNAVMDVLATAVVEGIEIVPFSVVQNVQLVDNVHPELRHWSNAFAFLQARHLEFQQTENVTLVTFIPTLQPVQTHKEEAEGLDVEFEATEGIEEDGN